MRPVPILISTTKSTVNEKNTQIMAIYIYIYIYSMYFKLVLETIINKKKCHKDTQLERMLWSSFMNFKTI